MRKHFLILMLFALLPLAGWAQPGGKTEYAGTNVDLSHDWSIWLSATASTYTGGDIRPDVYLVSSTEYISAEGHFNVQWSATNVRDFVEGGYTVTVTPDNTFSYNALPKPTAKFMILKSNLTVENAGALQDNPGSGVEYSGNAITLVKTAPTVKIGATSTKVTGLKYAVTASTVTKAPSTGWSTSFPTATEVGEYTVWFKAEATNNYNEITGKVANATYEIVGRTLVVNTDYTAPLPTAEDLKFTWENNAAKPLNLVKAGTGTIAAAKGTFKYAVLPHSTTPTGSTVWTDTPTASAAGTYDVFWKIEGGTGYKDVAYDATHYVTKAIEQATTVITSAVGKTGLSYKVDGDHKQALIQTAASATNGASSVIKYQVKYSDDEGAHWSSWSAATAKLEEVTGDKAGLYEIKSLMEANQNYAIPEAKTTRVTIAKANAFTSVPTAADLTWNKTDQVLIAAGANTVEGVVEYASGTATAPTSAWVTDLTTIKGQNAGDYYVWYRVDGATHTNFVNVPATVVKDVKIKRKDLTVTVNNITKTYDATANYTGTTIDGNAAAGAAAAADEARFTFAGRIANDGLSFSSAAVPYVDLAAACKNAGEYAEAVKVLETKLKAVSDNYRYTIIPGKLTVNKAKLKVDAKTKHVTFGNPYDIRGEWTATGLQGSDEATTAENVGIFQTMPVLTTNAAATNPAPGEYDYTFNKGVLKTTAPGSNYEMDTTYGENKDGYKIGTAKFIVDQDPDAKVIITVAPHTQAYTGVAESWEGMQPGVDYYVTGLIDGDALTAYPTLSRSDATNFNVGVYDLEATGAAVADIAKYPGGIIYQKSTFTITKAELTATVNPQTITTLENNSNIDQDAWTVTGLVGPDATTGKSVLNATLAINVDPSDTEAAIMATPKVYNHGLKLTIISGNYTLKAGSEFGQLRIINPTTLELNDAEDMTTVLASANNSTTTDISFNSRTLKKDTWNTLILPFDIKVRDLSDKLGYAVVDMLDKSNADKNKVIFKIATGKIPANTPFMIKTDEAVNLQSIVFTAGTHFTKIAYTTAATCEIADAAGNKMTGAYKPQTVNDGEYYMTGSGSWKKYEGTGFDINGERVKFTKASASVSAPVFYIEEGDGTMTVIDGETTAITTISAESLKANDGWYTLNGVKLQSVPTEKGIYINNGKKVVIK